MKIATILLAGTLVLSVSGVARADDATGLVTQLNRLTNTISIKRVQTGTVGANISGAAENYRSRTDCRPTIFTPATGSASRAPTRTA